MAKRDSVKARKEADLAGWVTENGLIWPDGVNASKIKLIRSAAGRAKREELLSVSEWQWWLDKARDASYSVLEKDLIKKGWLPRGTIKGGRR